MIWESNKPFEATDFVQSVLPIFSDVTQSINGGNASSATDPFGNTTKPTGKPAITLLTDYWLRAENNEVIQFETGENISLEFI